MFQWRWKLRRAEQAVDDGRYDEATRLLSDPELREFLPAKRLANRLATELASRAEQRLADGRSAAGFADLAIAEQVAPRETSFTHVRQGYADRTAREAAQRLAIGDYSAAADVVARASQQGAENKTLRLLAEIAHKCHAATTAADRGDLGLAEKSFAQARRLVGLLPTAQSPAARGTIDKAHPMLKLDAALERQTEALAIRSRLHATARARMQQAVEAEDWSAALTAVDDVLRHAANDPQAVRVRRQAWKRLGLELTRTHHPRRPPVADSSRGRAAAAAAGRELRRSSQTDRKQARRQPEDETVSRQPLTNRRMLWIDSVGSLLVCLDDEIVLGQPADDPARSPAVAILADLSRRHAVVRRETGRYVLQPHGRVWIDGREVIDITVLPDECVIELGHRDGSSKPHGAAVRFRFEKPHALSATARLTPASGHRLAPPADAVLLMADSCVLGPAAHCHVRCRDWQDDIVLYRQPHTEAQLMCRAKTPLLVDGVEQTRPVELVGNPRLEGQDFAFSVEELDAEN